MRRMTWTVGLYWSIVAAVATHPTSAAEPVGHGFPTGDVASVQTVVTLADVPGAARLWAPHLAISVQGNLVVALGAMLPNKSDMGDILACVSTNQGKQWNPSVTVFDHRHADGGPEFAYANPILYQPPGDARLWCFAMRCPLTEAHSEDSELVAATSSDGGQSWIGVPLQTHGIAPIIIAGSVLRYASSERTIYLLPGHRNTLRSNPEGVREQFILESDDLVEWRCAGTIPQPVERRVFLHEGHLALGDEPGTLELVTRTSDYLTEGRILDPPRAYRSTSLDGGRTWTAATSAPGLFNNASKGFFTRSSTGQYVYVYNDGPGNRREALRYRLR